MNTTRITPDNKLSRRFVIKHAGSLNAAFGAINKEFLSLHPDIDIVDTGGGSAGLMRGVIKGEDCSVIASADYQLLAKWMLPDLADWYLIFAPNEFMLRCSDKCPYHEEINSQNWCNILQRKEVMFWRPDPGDDPGGYRTLMILQLAEKYYRIPGLFDKIMAPNKSFIPVPENYPMVNTSYTFAYRSSPCPSGQWNIKLPDEINLGSQEFAETYRQATVRINGRNPAEKLTLYGEPMLFGLTIPKNSLNKAAAIEWVRFLLSDTGSAIMEKAGMKLAKPIVASDYSKIPPELKEYIR
jgi:molybdate/tungstate transport system substrate-binding protein